jgi:serine/threonine protein kinase
MILEKEVPKVLGFSNEFNDLLIKLLDKDPIKRMNWDEIKAHPFWTLGSYKYEFTKRLYPPQQ